MGSWILNSHPVSFCLTLALPVHFGEGSHKSFTSIFSSCIPKWTKSMSIPQVFEQSLFLFFLLETFADPFKKSKDLHKLFCDYQASTMKKNRLSSSTAWCSGWSSWPPSLPPPPLPTGDTTLGRPGSASWAARRRPCQGGCSSGS